MTTSGPSVILCPGQGAQHVGMGAAWAGSSPAARAVFERADAVLGTPLSRVCFEGPEDTINRTDVCQPAIFAASIASFEGWLETEGLVRDEIVVAAAGLSLGEYTALHLAGSLSFDDALRLVSIRGAAMQEAALATDSGMLALVGIDEQQANDLCDASRGPGVLVCANFNAPGQVVLSGDSDAIGRAEQAASAEGYRSVRLPVAGAFHCPLMAPAAQTLRAALDAAEILPPSFPVMSNVTAAPHERDAASIRERLVEQLTHPVRWAACCEHLVGSFGGSAFHELAPGRSLSGMMKRIDRKTKVASHPEPASVS